MISHQCRCQIMTFDHHWSFSCSIRIFPSRPSSCVRVCRMGKCPFSFLFLTKQSRYFSFVDDYLRLFFNNSIAALSTECFESPFSTLTYAAFFKKVGPAFLWEPSCDCADSPWDVCRAVNNHTDFREAFVEFPRCHINQTRLRLSNPAVAFLLL